jgi:hypothetical protein
MIGSNYWNGDTILLFGVEIQALVSSLCSPETSCYSSSSNSITSKLYLVPRRGRVGRIKVLPSGSTRTELYNLVDEHMPMAWWEYYTAASSLNCVLVLASFSHKGAIYSQSRAPGSWRSNDTVTT